MSSFTAEQMQELAAMLAAAKESGKQELINSIKTNNSALGAKVDSALSKINSKPVEHTRNEFLARAGSIKVTLEGQNINNGKALVIYLQPQVMGKKENLDTAKGELGLICGWSGDGPKTGLLSGSEIKLNCSMTIFASGSKKWRDGAQVATADNNYVAPSDLSEQAKAEKAKAEAAQEAELEAMLAAEETQPSPAQQVPVANHNTVKVVKNVA